jgi:hypothetical protein
MLMGVASLSQQKCRLCAGRCLPNSGAGYLSASGQRKSTRQHLCWQVCLCCPPINFIFPPRNRFPDIYLLFIFVAGCCT